MNEQVRKEFEEWISKPPFEHDCRRRPMDESQLTTCWPGSYVRYETEVAWEAWQEQERRKMAQAATSPPAPAPVTTWTLDVDGRRMSGHMPACGKVTLLVRDAGPASFGGRRTRRD